MKIVRRWVAACLACVMAVLMIPAAPMKAYGSDVRVYSDKIVRGKTGKNLSVSFTIKNTSGQDLKDLQIAFDVSGGEIWDEDEEDRTYGYAFPFEQTGGMHDTDNPKSIGDIAEGKEKNVSLTGQVRRDLSDGYYKVPVVVMRKDGAWIGNEDLRVWISKSTSSSSDDDDDEQNTYDFVLGEGQNTPDGVYPNVLNFNLNLRNNSPATVYNVKASMVLDPDSTKFPFEINDANYDRMFDKITVDETVQLDYSFAIRSDTYTGYYPIAMKIYYSKSSTGDQLETFETTFFVRVHNKDKEDEYGEFNEHDRTRARMIVDGFTTNPAAIVAGESFDLILKMKNASNNVAATNILFTVESEKVSDSAVFTTESGSSSVALDSLGPGASREIRLRLSSKAGVDQRSYGLTVKAKFDSPEFKNAEESMVVDIPIRQIPRLSTGTFEVTPESIAVGDESNIMFGINNTGRVMLYNVTARFEGDSIQTTDSYVGNIKPGETGNVDCMVSGAAPTADDGKIKVIISYEDENGELTEVEKEVTLMVTENLSEDDMMNMDNFEDVPEEKPGFLQQYQQFLLPAALGVIAVLVLIILVMAVKHHRQKKQELLSEEDESSDKEDS